MAVKGIKRLVIYLFSLLIIIVLLLIHRLTYKVNFYINGDNNVFIKLNDNYEDKGANYTYCSLFRCRNISAHVIVKNEVNNKSVGTYSVNYELFIKNKKYSLERKVTVYENENPVLTLKGKQEVTTCPNKDYVEEGYTAYDNYDGDITNKVEIIKEKNSIIYKVKDSSNNEVTAKRKLIYKDDEKPVINYHNTIVYLSLNDKYNDADVKATDNCDGNITSKIVKKGSVDTSKEGTYKVTYTVSDTMGNKTTLERTVKVTNITNIDDMKSNIESFIKDNKYKVSLLYYNINSGYTYKYNPDKVYYGASLIKTLDALYVYENMEVTTKLRNFVKNAITYSNNAAHGNLLNIIGFKTLKEYGESLGATNVLTFNDMCGNTTVLDQLVYYKKLWEVIHTNPLKDELKGYFLNNVGNYLKFDDTIPVMHKYGFYGSSYHDAGIVLDENPYIVIILTSEASKNPKYVINTLSKKIYDLHRLIEK